MIVTVWTSTSVLLLKVELWYPVSMAFRYGVEIWRCFGYIIASRMALYITILGSLRKQVPNELLRPIYKKNL